MHATVSVSRYAVLVQFLTVVMRYTNPRLLYFTLLRSVDFINESPSAGYYIRLDEIVTVHCRTVERWNASTVHYNLYSVLLQVYHDASR